jgi:bacteriocin biosynthesis cyclodehydratase domain-containing protein
VRAGADTARPRLKPWYRLATCDAGLTARFGESVLLFEGRAARELLPALLPLLDGTRTPDELVARFGSRTRPAVEHAIEILAAHDLLVDGPVPAGPAGELLAATDWRPRALGRATVAVAGEGATAAEIARLLRDSGVGAVVDGWASDRRPGELVIAAPDDEPAERMATWNAAALEQRVPWLAVTPFDGSIATVGPLMVPGETACHTCLTLRRGTDLHAGRERLLVDRHVSSPALRSLCAGLAATAALRWLATGDAPIVGAILAVEYASQLVTRHPVHRVPRCPSCSPTAATAALAPWGRPDAVAA